MKQYRTSLKSWRNRQTAPLEEMLPLYIWTFGSILDAMQLFSDHKVNHFDIKCDNILLEPLKDDMPDSEFWDSSHGSPTFSVVLADFGESKVCVSTCHLCIDQLYNFRERGTNQIR